MAVLLLVVLALLRLAHAHGSDGTLAPILTVSQARAALAGHYVLFVGNSVSRDEHFAMIAWLLECNTTAPTTPSTTPSAAATPGPLLRADICFAAVTRLKDWRLRITILSGGVGLPDFTIRFAGATFADSVASTLVQALESQLPTPEVCWPPGHELCRIVGNASLLPSSGLRIMPDLIVANTGLWHLLRPRTRYDFYNMSGSLEVLTAALTATPALAAQTRELVVWRTITPPEPQIKAPVTSFGDNNSWFDRATVTRVNADAVRVLRSAGITVFDVEPYFPSGAGVTTEDSVHPKPAVHVAMLSGLLQAARPFWVGELSATPVSSVTQRATPHAPGASDAHVVALFGNRREGAVWYRAASAFPFVLVVVIPMVACAAALRAGWFSTEQAARG